MKKMNPVVHFEMPLTNKERASKFYKSAFGWELQQMGAEFGDYIIAMTTESDKKGPKKKGIINGGFYPKTKQANSTHLVVAVDDIKKHIAIVKKAGGKILGKVMNIPNVGEFVMINDTEGNKVAMLQPVEM